MVLKKRFLQKKRQGKQSSTLFNIEKRQYLSPRRLERCIIANRNLNNFNLMLYRDLGLESEEDVFLEAAEKGKQNQNGGI